jgi:hypothetical protein
MLDALKHGFSRISKSGKFATAYFFGRDQEQSKVLP